jgi:hypothetical protein
VESDETSDSFSGTKAAHSSSTTEFSAFSLSLEDIVLYYIQSAADNKPINLFLFSFFFVSGLNATKRPRNDSENKKKATKAFLHTV